MGDRHIELDHRATSDASNLGRRPFLYGLGAAGAAGIAGVPGLSAADHVEGWPAVDDPYYAALVEELQEMGLPPASFVYGDSETETHDVYWTNGTDATTIEALDVGDDDVPFSEATRFVVEEAPDNAWDVQIRGDVEDRGIDAGDVYLGVVWLRAPEGPAEVQYLLQADTGSFSNEVVGDAQPTVGEEWERYVFRIESGKSDDAGNWWTECWLGLDAGTVDVGGLALLDFADDVDVEALPAWDADGDGGESGDGGGDEIEEWPDVDDPYYAGLVDELSALDVSPARFVYAENEADTFATYEVDGNETDLLERHDLDVGDDVPFTEATRLEVTDQPENAWGINLKATVEDRPIASGDVLLGVAWLRTPDSEAATITYKASESGDEAANHVLNGGVNDVGGEWRRYFFPISFGADAEAGEWWTELWVGATAQTVDVGGLALLDFAGGADANALPSWEDDVQLPSGWEEEADERIREHRMGDLVVEVVDADGDPIEGAAVDVAMQEHAFTFGTAVNASIVTAEGEDADRYRETVRDLFNTAVMENQHKWRFFEEDRALADEATEWLLDQGLSMRGHACLWGSVDSWSVPPDVVDALGIEHDSGGGNPDLDPDHVEERSFEHLETVIDHYADFGEYGNALEHWDVVNEVVHEPAMIEAIDGDDVDPVEAPVLAEWYRRATEVAPDDVALDVNDYNVFVGPYEGTRQAYERQIEFLAEAEGVDLGGIGMQCHFSRSEMLTPDEILEGLDRYAEYGVDLRVTEFDMSDEDWLETDKADFFHWFLKTIFSHPSVTDFLMWGFRDTDHWRDDAPLFADGWEEKPSYDVYTDLVFDEWWTEEDGETDADGTYEVGGFLGEYEITASHDGLEETVTATIEGDGETVEVVLDPDGGSGGDDGDGDDGGSEDDGDPLPGFGALSGLAALAGLAGVGIRRLQGDDAST